MLPEPGPVAFALGLTPSPLLALRLGLGPEPAAILSPQLANCGPWDSVSIITVCVCACMYVLLACFSGESDKSQGPMEHTCLPEIPL